MPVHGPLPEPKQEEEEESLKQERKCSTKVQCQRQILEEKIIENILKHLDLQDYQKQLLNKLEDIMKKSMEQELEIEERIIMQIILTQLVGLSVYDPALLAEQLAVKEQLTAGLFTKENVRKYIQVYLYIT